MTNTLQTFAFVATTFAATLPVVSALGAEPSRGPEEPEPPSEIMGVEIEPGGAVRTFGGGSPRRDLDGWAVPYAGHLPGDLLPVLCAEQKVRDAPQNRVMLESLQRSKLPTARDAVATSCGAIRRLVPGFGGAPPEVVGLVRSGVSIPGYAARGDLLWIVRFLGECGLRDAWISTTTREIRWITLPEPLKRLPVPGTITLPEARAAVPPDRKDYDGYALPKAAFLPGDQLWVLGASKHPLQGVQGLDILKALAAAKVTRPKAAFEMAVAARTKVTGPEKDIRALVIGLVESARSNVGPFRDLIWIIRFTNAQQEVVQEAWISAATGEMAWIFPLGAPKGKQ